MVWSPDRGFTHEKTAQFKLLPPFRDPQASFLNIGVLLLPGSSVLDPAPLPPELLLLNLLRVRDAEIKQVSRLARDVQ